MGTYQTNTVPKEDQKPAGKHQIFQTQLFHLGIMTESSMLQKFQAPLPLYLSLEPVHIIHSDYIHRCYMPLASSTSWDLLTIYISNSLYHTALKCSFRDSTVTHIFWPPPGHKLSPPTLLLLSSGL